MSFNYIAIDLATSVPTRQVAKRGRTQRMLSQLDMQLDAEEATSAQPVWKDVYERMKCPGPPCRLGRYCWIDGIGKKYYNLKPHRMKSLIKYVEQGGILETHDDVPSEVREQLYAEEQQEAEHQRKRKARSHSLADYPPIQITNVLPSQYPEASTARSVSSSRRLNIPGFREDAVQRYTDWHYSQVRTEEFKAEYRRAGDLTLIECLSLNQVHEDHNVEFYMAKGVKRGAALSFVSDIEVWAEQLEEV